MLRVALGFVTLVLAAMPAAAQTVNLTEKTAPGDRATYALDFTLKGNLVLALESGKQSVPLEATARHRFTERTVAVTEGLPSTTARYYTEATARAFVGADRSVRSLPADRRVVIVRQGHEGRSCFALAGPLTRDELELVSDHFNPQCLPGLLPGKTVTVGDTWTVGEAATQVACGFDAALKANLVGKLTALKDGVAAFTIDGPAEGLETGAKASLTVEAKGTFDVASGHITRLSWKQRDERDQGPVNPASHVEAAVLLTRVAPTADPKELADAVLAGIPSAEIPARLLQLRHVDPRGRYQLLHAREWYATGQTDAHLVLRLVDRGEFIAQATVTVWSKAEAGKHLPIEDFKKAAAAAPNWSPGRTLLDREWPTSTGRWLYQLTVEGKMEDVPVIQTFYFLAGPQGDQLVVTVAAKPDRVKSMGLRDLDLVNAIEFGRK